MGLFFALIFFAAVIFWLRKEISRKNNSFGMMVNSPMLSAIPVVRQLCYAWWLFTGLYPSRRRTITRHRNPIQFCFLSASLHLLLFSMYVAFFMVLVQFLGLWDII